MGYGKYKTKIQNNWPNIWSAPPSCEKIRMRDIGGALDVYLIRSDNEAVNPTSVKPIRQRQPSPSIVLRSKAAADMSHADLLARGAAHSKSPHFKNKLS